MYVLLLKLTAPHTTVREKAAQRNQVHLIVVHPSFNNYNQHGTEAKRNKDHEEGFNHKNNILHLTKHLHFTKTYNMPSNCHR